MKTLPTFDVMEQKPIQIEKQKKCDDKRKRSNHIEKML